MGFVAPLTLLFAALSLPILILYMLRLRRERVTVSSVLLWQQVLRDRQANAPWQRLRRNLLLLLQLLVLAALVMALARPYSRSESVPRVQGNVILLLDASASMQATDATPFRFEVARAQAEQLVDDLGAQDTMTVIAVSDVPRVLAARTSDRAALRQALAAAQVSNAEADWSAALVLGAQQATAGTSDRGRNAFVLLSDGGLAMPGGPAPAYPDLPGEVYYIPIGTSAENRALSALALRDGPRGQQAFIRATNAGTQATTALLQLYVDGALFDARTLSLDPGGEAGLTIDDLPLDAEQIEVRLRHPEGEESDHLALDDVAWAVRPTGGGGGGERTVLLVTPGNAFLERALNLLPGLSPIVVPVTETLAYTRTVGPASPPALYIYDGVVPETLPESGNLFFIAPPASTALFDVTGPLTRTQVVRVTHDSPLLRYTNLEDVRVAQARAISPPSWARMLVEADGGPLLLAGEIGGRRVAVLAFDLHQSDLPLQIGFPILIANLLDWLMPASAIAVPGAPGQGDTATGVTSVRPGTPVLIYPPPGTPGGTPTAEIAVVGPSGQRWVLSAAGDSLQPGGEPVPFAETYVPGIYSVEAGGEVPRIIARFAVNPFSDLESYIAPRDSIDIGTFSRRDLESPSSATAGRREWWRWAAMLGAAVLLVEWVVDKGVGIRVGRRTEDGGRWTIAPRPSRAPGLGTGRPEGGAMDDRR